MSAYDHRFSVLSVDGRSISDWADGTDVLQINPTDDIGSLTNGINNSVFVSTNKNGAQLVVTLLQNSADSKFLNDRLKSQGNLKTHSPIQAYYKDTVNGDEIKLINGWFTAKPAYVRGNGHNNMVYTINFEQEDRILTEGKN